MSDDQPTVRQHLHESVQATVPLDEGLPEGSMLKGWILVAEWVAPDNGGWLTRLSGGPGTLEDESGLPEWQEQGYLFNALHMSHAFGSDDETDED